MILKSPFSILLSDYIDHPRLGFIKKNAILSPVSNSGARPRQRWVSCLHWTMAHCRRVNTGLPSEALLQPCKLDCIMESF